MKKFLLIGMSLILCVSFRAKTQTLDDAVQYLRQKNYASAKEICDKLLAESTNDASVPAVRSLVYTATGKYEQAMQDADKALSVNNSSDKAHYARAEVLYYGKKDYNGALQEYNAATRSNARMTEAYAGKARAYMGLQNYKEALKVTEDALKDFPNDPELHYTHGLLNFQRGKVRAAVEDYDKVLSINPKWNASQVYLNRGFANDADLKPDSAIEDFTKAIAVDPNSSVTYIARGNIRYADGQYKEAVEDFKKAEILNPNNSVITYNIGMAYYKDDDRASACKYFQKSCSQGNNNACKMVVLNCSDRKIN